MPPVRRPFRLLLAYSSARAFLTYEAELRQRRVEIEQVLGARGL